MPTQGGCVRKGACRSRHKGGAGAAGVIKAWFVCSRLHHWDHQTIKGQGRTLPVGNRHARPVRQSHSMHCMGTPATDITNTSSPQDINDTV